MAELKENKLNTKGKTRKRPGPYAAGGLSWAGMDSFFDKTVQAVLSTRKEYLGRPIRFWEIVEEVTNQRHPIPGRKISSHVEKDEDEEQRIWGES